MNCLGKVVSSGEQKGSIRKPPSIGQEILCRPIKGYIPGGGEGWRVEIAVGLGILSPLTQVHKWHHFGPAIFFLTNYAFLIRLSDEICNKN